MWGLYNHSFPTFISNKQMDSMMMQWLSLCSFTADGSYVHPFSSAYPGRGGGA